VKEGGRMEKRWVWKVSVYASRIVLPSLDHFAGVSIGEAKQAAKRMFYESLKE
jgi:hypothetical protein